MKKPEAYEDMDVRRVHGAIWREYPEPRELWWRTPALLRHFYVILTIGVTLYFIGWFPRWSWKALDQGSRERAGAPAAENSR
jgi:hypothetical protein